MWSTTLLLHSLKAVWNSKTRSSNLFSKSDNYLRRYGYLEWRWDVRRIRCARILDGFFPGWKCHLRAKFYQDDEKFAEWQQRVNMSRGGFVPGMEISRTWREWYECWGPTLCTKRKYSHNPFARRHILMFGDIEATLNNLPTEIILLIFKILGKKKDWQNDDPARQPQSQHVSVWQTPDSAASSRACTPNQFPGPLVCRIDQVFAFLIVGIILPWTISAPSLVQLTESMEMIRSSLTTSHCFIDQFMAMSWACRNESSISDMNVRRTGNFSVMLMVLSSPRLD